MGKTAIIKSLAKCIGNVVLHKIVLRHTNMPESFKHLQGEIRDYTSDAFEKSQLYTWTNEEKEEIKAKSKIRVKNSLERYLDVSCDESEIDSFLTETIDEMSL